jgi:hypothetical protein
MTLFRNFHLGWILLALAVVPATACRVDDKPVAHQSSSTDAPMSVASAPDTVCASTQILAVDVSTGTPRLPASGGAARFTVTVTTLIDLTESWIDIRVPAGVRKPAGYPRNIGLAVGEAHQHSFELILPPGSARHDIVAGLLAVHRGVNVAQFNNVWIAVGNPVEPEPILTRSGSSLVREVRFGDPLRRDGR